MHGNLRLRGTFCEWGILCCQQSGVVSTVAKSSQGKQRLALPAAPFALQVHIQHFHSCARFPALLTSCPSFLYFSRTERAAIWAIERRDTRPEIRPAGRNSE